MFLPKEDGAKEMEEFRTISLLNVEGKLFFALKAKRLLTFALANKYIDTQYKKGEYQKCQAVWSTLPYFQS